MTTALWFKDRYYNLLLLSKNNNNKLNGVEERELSSYKIILENQIYYNQRDLYISFIEEYLRENAAGTDGTGLFIYFLLYIGKVRATVELWKRRFWKQESRD